MTVVSAFGAGDILERQARIARRLGSPFVAAVLTACAQELWRAPRLELVFNTWPGNPADAALGLRLNGALHALARQGVPELRALYRRLDGDFDRAVGAALAAHEAFILAWIKRPTQTNEVARLGAIMPAIVEASHRFGHPLELLELGSSCGLNLNLEHYRYDLGGVRLGSPTASVKIAPAWRGRAPRDGAVQIAGAQGVDRNPLTASSEPDRERLLAYVWADQPARIERLSAALTVARQHPPEVSQGDALPWLDDRLQVPSAPAITRVVFHSMFVQYLSPARQQWLHDLLHAAGAMATRDRPLVHVSYEWAGNRSAVLVTMAMWPDGESRVVAEVDPYGAWVDWRGWDSAA